MAGEIFTKIEEFTKLTFDFIYELVLSFTIKDWLIVASSFVLLFSILEIRRYKRFIRRQARRRMFPQLKLELILEAGGEGPGLYLENESPFVARDIKIDDVEFRVQEAGFSVGVTNQFDFIEEIKPKEANNLKFKVYDHDKYFLAEVTERLLPHLSNQPFKLKLTYYNIADVKFSVEYTKRGAKFYAKLLEIREQPFANK